MRKQEPGGHTCVDTCLLMHMATGSFYRTQDRGHPGGHCCHEVPMFLLHLPACLPVCPGLERGFLSWGRMLLFRLPRQYLAHQKISRACKEKSSGLSQGSGGTLQHKCGRRTWAGVYIFNVCGSGPQFPRPHLHPFR